MLYPAIASAGATAQRCRCHPMGLLRSILNAVLDPSKENRNNLKGASGEAQGAFGMFLFLPKDYVVLHNVTVPTPKGTTQIDHVVVSRFGIHVIESKNIKGAIYGDPGQPKWTVFLGPKKFQILNPLVQNQAHIKALAAVLQLPERIFHSMVFFWSDDCRFKTVMPPNVLTEGLCTYIKSKQEILIAPDAVANVVRAIQTARLPDTEATAQAHVAQLKERFHTAHRAGDSCPRCPDGRLVLRTARSTGSSFLGCSNYPRCRHTEKVAPTA